MIRRGFTLIELLLVVSILAMLAALLFPVFAEAKRSAKEVTCLSNVRQIGLGMAIYVADADERYPWAYDPADRYSGIWDGLPERRSAVGTMVPLPDALLPYLPSLEVWQCPLDVGIDHAELTGGGAAGDTALAGHPTLYGKYGSSYRYRTELAFDGHTAPLDAHDLQNPSNPIGPSQITVVYDAGPWHEHVHAPGQDRHNALMADGHAMRQDGAAYVQGLLFPLD